jgi:uncharacterized protein YxjI
MSSNTATARLQSLTGFVVRQKITPMVNRYEIREPGTGGAPYGDVLAVAQQKRLALKEKVTFFADEGRTEPVFGFAARNVLDLAGVTDVTGADGSPIGTFRKDFAASLLRSTWHLDAPGRPTATGAERNVVIAIVRRFVFEHLPYHFDFTQPDGTTVMSVEKRFAWGRDSYDVTVNDPGLDRRLAAAVAVALDALQGR